MTRSSLAPVSAIVALLLSAAPALAAPPTLAVFGFDLINTSPAASTRAELDRTHALGEELVRDLEGSGQYKVINLIPDRAKLENGAEIINCNGCELEAARKAGAQFACYGWVQKVSNLILNINVVIEDAATGKVVKQGSADIRGNTDEIWHRGLKFLLDDRLLE